MMAVRNCRRHLNDVVIADQAASVWQQEQAHQYLQVVQSQIDITAATKAVEPGLQVQYPSFADGTEAFQELDDMNEQLDQCLDDDREEAANPYIPEVSIPEKVLYAFIVMFQGRYFSHEGGGLLLLFLNCIMTLLPLSNFFTFPRLATVRKLPGIDSMFSQGSIYVACSACHALYPQQHSVVANSRGKHVKYPDHPTQRPKRCDTALYIRAHGHYVPRKVFAYNKVKDCIGRLMSRAGVPSSSFNPGFGCCLEYKLDDS
ncbi:hypothetical protein LRAMOSA09102 [Lichtheimia ramosa]|uniref:Uncharacterized protein n=1 Tax=Lichtheimia ramosa TaxID=688394 RepID=A0A077WHE4_9FUNG|nr:hypothetical protein LRAMOSA09102 [Lichtheimia ramosa]